MTDHQKQQILTLRAQGQPIAQIAAAVGAPLNTVKTFCYRHRETEGPAMPAARTDFCQHCGAQIVQQEKQKPKKFCSQKCRETWWNHNHRTAGATLCAAHCAYCGAEFQKYIHSRQRFCSHACYINSRFGELSS